MTKKERDEAFRKARTAQLRQRTRIQRETHAELLRLLKEAEQRIAAILAATPSDYQAWMLPQQQAAIRQAMADIAAKMGETIDQAALSSWRAGIDLVDRPIAAGGLNIAAVLPQLDTAQLEAMRAFMTERMGDVGVTLANKINAQLGLVAIGSQGVSDAITQIERLIETGGRSRATTIVRTELGRAFAVATQQRMDQAREILPGLQKQWRRSGKLHSRPSHDAADGQIVDADKPFIVGGVALMHPRDPTAPAAETINCGCESLPYMARWDVANPGRKPFTPAELTASKFRRDLEASTPLRAIGTAEGSLRANTKAV